ETTADFQRALKDMPGGSRYGVATFSRHVTTQDRKALEAAGIRVLSPLQGTAYRVRVEKRLDKHFLQSSSLKPRLLELKPENRVEPRLWREDFDRFVTNAPDAEPRNYVLNADGTLNLTVLMHADVTQ